MPSKRSTTCYVCGHSRNSTAGKGLSFHCSPVKITSRPILNQWLRFLNLPQSSVWLDQKWREITLCSLHFTEDDYHGRQISLRKILKDDAVPTRNRPNGSGPLGDLFHGGNVITEHSPMVPLVVSTSGEDVTGQLSTTSEQDESDQIPTPVIGEEIHEEGGHSTCPKVSTPLNMPETLTRGVFPKFRLDHGRSKLTPRRNCMYKVAKVNNKKYLQMVRRHLVMKPSPVQPGQSKEINQAVDLPSEFYFSYKVNSLNSIQARRYSNRIKAACLAIQGRSSKTYKFLAQMFTLPCPRTSTHLYQSFPLSTGISKIVLKSMKAQLSTMSENDKICVLMFDEMSLAKHLDYDPHSDQILGYQDIGGSRSPIFADHALVFMVRGLVSGWKQPVAFHFGQAISKGNLENAVKDTVLALQCIGLKVVAVVSDTAQSNILALKSLATKTLSERDDPTFQIGDQKIFIFADPPHLLKVLRNNFLIYDVEYKEFEGEKRVAKFNLLKEFLEKEKNKRHSPVFPDKLSDRHLNPNSMDKMKVKLAAQLFSYTVSGELIFSSWAFQDNDVKHLGDFIREVDSLFDSFNSSSSDSKCYRRVVSDNSKHHRFWNEMLRILNDWKFVVRSPGLCSKQPQSKCFYFWRRNIIAVQALWKEVRALGVKRLATKNINKDPLDCFFGCVRKGGDTNTKPNCKSFLDRIKILSLNCISVKSTSQPANVLEMEINSLTDLLNSTSDENNDSQDIFQNLGGQTSTSTSLVPLCSVDKEVEVCTKWISQYTSNAGTDGAFGFDQNFLAFFLRNKRHFDFISSCFLCFKCVYLCHHTAFPPGKVTCDSCTSLNSSLSEEMFKILCSVMQQLQTIGHESQLSKKLKAHATSLPLSSLSCNEHKHEFQELILNFIIRTAIQNFCVRVNNHLCVHARKRKPHK